ncbi:hypothetical protein LTR74_017828 [Friedmanniomyces endolithicus]|nr:hypothetical protein LTR74_017828 [Friedmanniomyces endolithicus]
MLSCRLAELRQEVLGVLKDFVDFEFLFFLGLKVERRLQWDSCVCWFQERYVEHWMYSGVLR